MAEFVIGIQVSWVGSKRKPIYGVVDAIHRSAPNTVRVRIPNGNTFWRRTAGLTLVQAYKLEVPAANGRYRIDDDKGSYLVDVVDGVVLHTGLVRRKGTVEPHWKLAADHSVFVKMEDKRG